MRSLGAFGPIYCVSQSESVIRAMSKRRLLPAVRPFILNPRTPQQSSSGLRRRALWQGKNAEAAPAADTLRRRERGGAQGQRGRRPCPGTGSEVGTWAPVTASRRVATSFTRKAMLGSARQRGLREGFRTDQPEARLHMPHTKLFSIMRPPGM